MEKRGRTGKLKYDFNTARCCEIEYKPKTWIRVTCNEFRSFSGNRRILNVDNPNDLFYEDYNDPVYLFGTNKIINTNQHGVQFENGVDPRDQYRKRGRWRI